MAEKREIYRGAAKIVNIGAEEMPERMKAKLPESDRESACFIVYDVESAEREPRKFDVKCECSHRALTGRALEWNRREDGQTPTQMDVTIKDLVRQGLLPKGATEADLGAACADSHIGRVVTIAVTEDAKDDGTYWPARAKFVSPFSRVTGAAAADRIKAFIAGKPAPKVQTSAPETKAGGMPAPDEADGDDDMPF